MEHWLSEAMQALLSGRLAGEFLDEQRRRHLALMHDLTAARRTASTRDNLLLDYRLFHIEADLRWIDHACTRLDSSTSSTNAKAPEIQL